jgi:Arc/MetJ-type ribon-helix-helix transcriptional regulator
MEREDHAMEPMQISLTPELAEFVEQQVIGGGYEDPTDYVSSLIQSKQMELVREEVETLLEEGINSPSRPFTPEVFAEIRQRMHERIQQLKGL